MHNWIGIFGWIHDSFEIWISLIYIYIKHINCVKYHEIASIAFYDMCSLRCLHCILKQDFFLIWFGFRLQMKRIFHITVNWIHWGPHRSNTFNKMLLRGQLRNWNWLWFQLLNKERFLLIVGMESVVRSTKWCFFFKIHITMIFTQWSDIFSTEWISRLRGKGRKLWKFYEMYKPRKTSAGINRL